MTDFAASRAALARLRAGNDRFASNVRSVDAIASQNLRAALVDGHAPFAIVLSCSDSRAPAELVFDCGLGDLFVVRVAGNIVAPSLLGSVEFAVATFATPLVVVMGHTHCCAIAATVATLREEPTIPNSSIHSIVDRIAPSIIELVHANATEPDLRAAVRANARASTNQLRHGSRIIEEAIAEQRLMVVGALYDLETGRVDFFDVP